MNFKSFAIVRIFLKAIVLISLTIPAVFGQNPDNQNSIILNSETSQPSGGSYMLHQRSLQEYIDTNGDLPITFNGIEAIGNSFQGFNYVDNGSENSSFFIPPDPIGAVGTDRLIAVVNTMIEARDKSGTLLWRDALKDFFSYTGGIGTLGTFTFDPKVVWDHYENRFVVVTLERNDTFYGDPTNESRILLAVSRTASPASATSSDWWFYAIDSKVNISGTDCWADYPGFEIDEEAIYITNNMFQFISLGGANSGVRLWIVDKGVSGGFYNGGTVSWTIHNPYASGGTATTTMPALIYGTGGVGTGIGTFLVSYSGLTFGGPGANEAIQVVRVDNPLGAVAFTQEYVTIGDIEDVGGIYGWPTLTDAPQSGSTFNIEVNDRRALDAVWRNNRLWLTTTINPNSGSDAGETTAHWIRLNTSAVPVGVITLDDEGDIGGNDIHVSGGVYTFFPSLAVNNAGDAYFGFSASSANIYGGAYCAGRKSTDTAGTVRASETVWAGVAPYKRFFSGTRNRWGDYSGTALDPTDGNLFWIFNEFADTQGNTGSGSQGSEDGRWGTAWASVSFVQSIFTNGANATINFSQSSPSPPEADWPFGKFSLNNTGNDATIDSITINLSGSYTGLLGSNPFRLKANNVDNFATATDIGSDASESGGSVTFTNLNDALPTGTRYYWVTVDLSSSASGIISGSIASSDVIYLSGASLSNSSNYGDLNTGPDVSLPVELTSFKAEIVNNYITLNWRTQSEIDNVGFIVERSSDGIGQFEKSSSYKEDPSLKGLGNSATGKEYSFTDKNVETGNIYEYRLADISYSGVINYSDVIQIDFKDSFLPTEFTLNNAYPNPFNPVTTIRYGLPNVSEVKITIFDISGRKIKTIINSKQQAGWYDMQWHGVNDQNIRVSSGMYLYKMTAGNYTQTKKILIIR